MAETKRVNLTPGRISSHSCESGQSFLWDSTVGGLGLRSTPSGAKAFIVQSRFAGKAIRITLGDVTAITLEDARTEARRLLLMIEQGIDPREQKRQVIAEQEQQRESRTQEEALRSAQGATVGEIWQLYLEERRPKWGDRHYIDHLKLSQDGTAERRKGKGQHKPGPLAPLMPLCLSNLTPDRLEQWIGKEVADRPTQSRLALRLLQSFLNWCGEHPDYQHAIGATAITGKVKSVLPKKQAKQDCLQREQLTGWFAAVRQIQNPVIAAYLQALLLTGTRREELAWLKWEDVDFRWKSLTIKDKIEGERTLPLCPYTEQLLRFLPHRSEWVFSSPTAASGRLQSPFVAHRRALNIAGIENLTLHGLRRSFGSLSEWVELPVGIVAQIMGHKPSATAEKHYRVRPLDLLRQWHVKLEEWILEQAGIAIPARQEEQEALKLVVGGSGTK